MPFDGNPNDHVVKPDVFSLEGLIAWLETQDLATEYDFMNCRECLAANYLRSKTGEKFPSRKFRLAKIFPSNEDYGRIAARSPWNYGAALSRARALLAEGK